MKYDDDKYTRNKYGQPKSLGCFTMIGTVFVCVIAYMVMFSFFGGF